jgi:hypothetical protein
MRAKAIVRIAAGALCAIALVAASANAQSTTSTRTVKFELISVVGNQLVVRTPEGTREMTVPDNTRFIVDGKQVSVRDLKAGMAGEATVTTTTTLAPVYVTEARNVKVMQARGNSIIYTAPDGTFKLFTQEDVDKYKIQLTRDGKPIEFQQLKAQDTITATIITTKQQTLTQQEVNARLAAAGAPPVTASPAPAARPTASPVAATAPPPSAAPMTPTTLPKTASPLPLVGLSGVALLSLGALMTLVRRRARN